MDRQLQTVVDFPGSPAKTDDGVSFAAKAADSRLKPRFAMAFFDGLSIKVREHGSVTGKKMQLALGILADGTKEILAHRFEPGRTGPAQFVESLKARGVNDILIVVTDGCPELARAVRDGFPEALLITGIKLVTERSLERIPARDKKHAAAALAQIAAAPDAQTALAMLDAFDARWRDRYPFAASAWRTHWDGIAPHFALPQAIRDVIASTSAVESMTAKLRRRAVRIRSHYASDEVASLHLMDAMRDASPGWRVSPVKWTAAQVQLAQLFGDRFSA